MEGWISYSSIAAAVSHLGHAQLQVKTQFINRNVARPADISVDPLLGFLSLLVHMASGVV